MHRIDTEGNEDGLFRDGTPAIGQQGTIMDAAWANGLQENVCGVIEGAGLTLEKGEHGQLLEAIGTLISNSAAAARVPVGTVIMFDGPAAPAGYLPLDGSQHVRATYADLVAFYTGQARLIAGDDGAQFRTPDYRGRLPRGWSADNAVDPDGPRAPGTLQADAFASHTHGVSPSSSDSEGGAGRTVTGSTGTTETLTPYATAASGGTETRPRNFATLYAVKF